MTADDRPAGSRRGGLTLELSLLLRNADGRVTGKAVTRIDSKISTAEALALYPAAPALLAALEMLSGGNDEPCWCPWRDHGGYHTSRCRQAQEAISAARGAEADDEAEVQGDGE